MVRVISGVLSVSKIESAGARCSQSSLGGPSPARWLRAAGILFVGGARRRFAGGGDTLEPARDAVDRRVSTW